MPDLSHCPDGEELRQLASGTLAPVSAEPVLHHLRQCRSCLSALEGMPIEDTLIEALQTWGDRARDGDKAAVAGLIQRLKKLVVGPAADPEATAADAPATRANVFDFLSPPQGADEIGRLGGYRVVKVLGQGGMGVVFAAEDVRLKRKVALKVMKPELAANTGARQRFLREAEASAAVRSDHVITIYQVGEQGDAPFLAMEYLEGMSLDDWLKKGRKPTLAQAARMGRQIALGLAAAHERGLIHRDIKPGNIWLESHHQGRVKLLDFGLARGTTDEVQLTQSGAIVGTPAYMAPEQARGEHVDHRCDLFSLGVVLYRLTTGQLPFRGDNTMSVLTSLALDTPKPPREIDTNIPPRMATLIECLLSKDREQRPKTAKAAADELAAIEREATQPAMDDRTVQIRAASVSERLTRGADATPLAAPSRSRLRWLVAASLMLLLGGVAAAIIVIIRDKAGNKVAEMDVPPGGTVETKDKAEGNAKAPPKEDTKIAAAPLPPLLPGEPLSPTALVRQPTKLPGVRSWSIETRNVWSPSAVAYRPDGKRLAVGSVDGSIRVWEPQTGRLVQMLLGSSHVASLAWSPDGRVLAAGGHTEKQLVRLWDAEKGRLLRALEVPDAQSILGFAWSPDGRTLRAWTGGHCLAWRTTDGKLLRKYLCPGGSLAFSPDGKRLAISGADRASVSIRDADTGVEIRKLSGIKEGRGVGWSPDGKRVACAAEEGVRVWETETSKEIAHYDVKDFSGHCVGVVWSPDGRSLAVDMQDRVVLLEVAGVAKPRSIEGGLGPTPAWSPDGKRIARATCIIDIATGGLVRTLSEGVGGLDVAWSPDGPRFAAYVWNTNQAYLSSLDNGQVFAVLKDAGGRAAWSADGKFVATSSPNGNVLVFDAAGKRLHTLAGHQGYLAGMAWSPDGKRLATCAAPEKRVLLWDLEKGQLLHELGPFAAATAGVRWSPDGRLVAFQVAGCGWHIWDVEQNKLANDPKQWMLYEGGGPVGLRFAPDSRAALVNKSEDGLWRLRNLATRTEGKPLPVCTPPVWSPDGRLLAVPLVTVTPETRDLVELWTGDLRRRVRTLRATIANVSMAGFSRDGKLVAGMSGERLHVWETDTGRLRGILLPHPSANGLTITADGHYTGNEQVERGIVMVVQKNDGTQEVLEPADFEQKYGWKNDPNKVHLLQPLPPSLYPLPGMPMGHTALVREPAVLPDAWSWTIETVSARGAVKAVAYRPDGKQLASGGEDGAIRIWDTASGKLVRMLVGDPVESLWWSKDGKVLTALGANEGEGREWDADTGRPLRRIAGVAKHSMKTASSPDGKQTATADEHGVHLLDAASGKRTHTLEESIHHGITFLTWSPDGRSLALTPDGSLRVMEASTGWRLPLAGSEYRAAAWSPDGKIFATTKGHEVFLLDTISSRVIRRLEGSINSATEVAWSADGKRLAGVGYFSVHVWSTETGKQLWQKDKRAFRAAWSPDGRRLASTDDDLKGVVRIWEAETGKLLHEVPLQSQALAWSPDGKTLLAGPADQGEAPLIDADSGTVRFKLTEGVRHLQCVRWSPDGKTFVTLSNEGLLRVWDAANGAARRTVQLPGVLDFILSAAWSPDGQMLAWENGCAIHLNDNDGHPLGVLLPFDAFGRLAVTADGRYRGNARVERAIRMVVQKKDGTTETLTPREFEQKYGFQNDFDKVRLIDK